METLYDMETGELKELWESDLDPAMHDLNTTDADMHDWFLERDVKMPQVIMHDKLLTDALLGTLPIKTEHSYSLNSDGDSMPNSPHSLRNKMEDIDDECYTVTMHTTKNRHNCTTKLLHSSACSTNDNSSISSSDIDVDDSNVKDEPMSPSSSCPPSPTSSTTTPTTTQTQKYGINVNLANVASYTKTDLVFEHKNGSLQLSPASQSLLKNQHILTLNTSSTQQLSATTMTTTAATAAATVAATASAQQSTAGIKQSRISIVPKLNIKMEPQMSTFGLPPTPPSSLSSDDSEGNQSPEHNLSPMSPPTPASSSRRSSHNSSTATTTQSRGYNGASSRQPIHTPLISSQPKGSTGSLLLTEEEKRTLLAEGYPIPTRLPLTKAEEKSLKKIRRKIKNKISAQESRRKKKEYMDQLERKVEVLVSENTDYRKRVDTLEDSNANLLTQLAKLQALLNRQNMKKC